MKNHPDLASSRDKLLFTPGPLTTSLAVKQAMLHDAGSWHFEFNQRVGNIRERLLEIAGVSSARGWEAIPLQGSGTFGVEAVFQTCVPSGGRVAVLSNGAYGDRMVQMLKSARIDHLVLRAEESAPLSAASVALVLAQNADVTHVAAVHCETTTGILNPIADIGEVVKKQGRTFIVDAMSSFGGMKIDLEGWGIDFLISSANKCLEGVPGFSFVLCRRRVLEACEGSARSLSLDLLGQLRGFDKNGQFRFTPPTHALLAFHQALDELDGEGGVAGRAGRYQRNHATLLAGMHSLGFRSLLPPEVQSWFITAFLYPEDSRFSFPRFYDQLSDRGFIIYPGKLSQLNTFRIGTIGRLFPGDFEQLVFAIGGALRAMEVRL